VSGSSAETPRPLHRNPVAWLSALVALLILVVSFGAWMAVRAVRQLPHVAAAEGRAIAHDVGARIDALVQGFRTGTVQRRFSAYTTSLVGTSYLQVATLQQLQTFELEDREAVLWGTVELPPVTVRASAPVAYTYFVDLHAPWRLELRDRPAVGGAPASRGVLVLAPPLRWNRPAVDVSRMRWQVVQGSLLRDEYAVQEHLRHEITGRSAIQAKANVPLVRETARTQVAGFVREWILRSYPDSQQLPVQVYFADEAPAFQAELAR
jgi:hypothetical protein